MLAAPKVGAPVKWIEDRRENLLAAGQVAPRARRRSRWRSTPTARSRPRTSTSSSDCGAYPTPWPVGTAAAVGMLFPGPVPRARAPASRPRRSTRTPSGAPPYRGPWQFESLAREVLLDIAARQMGIDPVELRRRNLLRRDELPYANPNGMPYDSISPLETFEQALAMLDYDAFRAEQAAARARRPLPRRRPVRPTSSRRRPGFGSYAHRGGDDPHRAVGHGQRVHRRRLDREQPRDDGRAAHRRRARREHRRRQHDPGRHRGHRLRRGHGRQPQRVDDRRRGARDRRRSCASASSRSPRTSSRPRSTTSSSPTAGRTVRGTPVDRHLARASSPRSRTSSRRSLPPGVPAGLEASARYTADGAVDLGERHARVHVRGRRRHRPRARCCATS